MATRKNKKICKKGHVFYKASDCPTCPICSKENKPNDGFLSELSSPARNTLIHHEITTIKKLSTFTEKEILKLHGMGPASIPTLKACLKKAGLKFKS